MKIIFDELHGDDIAVLDFSGQMREKLQKKREQGYSGWDDPEKCSTELLSNLLREHVEKGDPVDVANFCMMLHMRGDKILKNSS